MKIACIGTGFVGVVTSAAFAKLGHQVVGLDIDEEKIKSLQKGEVPFFEPKLKDLIRQTLDSGNLSFTTSYAQAIEGAEVIFIMVNTPSAEDGQANTKYVEQSAHMLAPHLEDKSIIVIKSTVPPSTNKKLQEIIKERTKASFATTSVPEFLKEGSAVDDTLNPSRVLIGTNDPKAVEKLTKLHEPLTDNIIIMKPESAQMAKYASNSYLAQRITFINQIANLCEKNGADVEEVIKGMGQDPRIGEHYWYPGLGYGGSCFPKDVKEIASYARAVGETDSLFIKIDELNEKRIPRLMNNYEKLIGGFEDKKVAVLGLSFKPKTNDTRKAPALRVIPWLLKNKAEVSATDPKAIPEAKAQLSRIVSFEKDPYTAAENAHAIILLIEWQQYLDLDLAKLSSLMQKPKYLFDTRNQYKKQEVEKHGLKYKGVGR